MPWEFAAIAMKKAFLRIKSLNFFPNKCLRPAVALCDGLAGFHKS
ncbi:hypothetical protein JCM19237_2550 [Photobacterium aphoticum]|uniref:Uncharacterized protein n=1 Tax=Photobacterium aphoticum TaxID=754436 RepID=A0A090QX78_9GAMM|nr:hypothetical protein JCM19237_2550 [Photobacterium aphoticum]